VAARTGRCRATSWPTDIRSGKGVKSGRGLEKWFRVRDVYNIEIAEGQNDVVILTVTVAIDMMR
jgi:uncharacterized protein YxjI